MSVSRPLSGGCHCGRNKYIIQFPQNSRATRSAQVLFSNPHDSHLTPSLLSTPLPAYLRVPLAWYHSQTLPQLEDESRAQIHRVWTTTTTTTTSSLTTTTTTTTTATTGTATTMRHFCGFCGTPLSWWSESPAGEADFIRLALGSLSPRDLADLGELGLVPGSDEEEEEEGDEGGEQVEEGKEEGGSAGNAGHEGEAAATGARKEKEGRTAGDVGAVGEGVGLDVEGGEEEEGEGDAGRVGALPWFDSLTAGSRLGTLCRAKGVSLNKSGTKRVLWEVVEWTDEGDGDGPRKRKQGELEGDAVAKIVKR